MKKGAFLGVLLIVLIISGCTGSKNTSEGEALHRDKPPTVFLEIDGETYETILGSYCWNIFKDSTECVDTAGPVELLKDKEPIQIKAGEDIQLKMDYTPEPNEMYLSQTNNDEEIEIGISNNQFTAPDEKGTYFYSYGVWWKDEAETNVSRGDAFYAFALQVK